jgi:predicted CXXCH cytochrome family protein
MHKPYLALGIWISLLAVILLCSQVGPAAATPLTDAGTPTAVSTSAMSTQTITATASVTATGTVTTTPTVTATTSITTTPAVTTTATVTATGAATSTAGITTTATTTTTNSSALCLACHAPYDKLTAATADYHGWVGGETTSPHRYVPHESKDAKDIPDCTNCHAPHPVPPSASDIKAMPAPNTKYCYTCHHAMILQCHTCHD